MQDLNYIATQVPKLDANFFSQLDRNQFQQAVNDLTANNSALTTAQFYVKLAQLIAMAGDAHTAIYLYGTIPNLGFQSFPLRFRWLDDGVFVTRAPPEHADVLGTQLVRVGDYAIDDVVQHLASIIPHENDQWLHYVAVQYLPSQQVLQGLGILPDAPTSPLTFRTLAGVETTLQFDTSSATLLPALPPDQGPLPDYLQNQSTNYWYSYSSANRMLYFKYNVCEDIPGNPLSAFAAGLLNTVDTNPVDTFVFDFRGNTGGNSALINPLINGLAQRYTALLSNPRFRVYDVIDKGTFSSGMDDAEELKMPIPGLNLNTLVQSIGEPTGGKPQHFGNVTPFNLPASGIPGQYSTQSFAAPPGIPNLPSFDPDIPVAIRSTDYFARFDPVMGAILARSTGAPPAPTGGVITVNAASFRPEQGIAPGSLATAFGTFVQTPDEIRVGGLSGQITSAAASQVNFIVPASAPVGAATISVRAGGQELANGQATITATGPGVFVLQPDQSQPGAVENQDSTINTSANPAAQGSIVQIFATGFAPAPLEVFFADTPATVLYSGPVAQFPGLWQINAQVPSTGSGQIPIFLISGNLVSNAVTILVK
jgi:uncharacterized protein (TIGR03437 family)